MKFATLVAFVAVAHAQDEAPVEEEAVVEPVAYGAECSEELPCELETDTCVMAADGMTGYCQDCAAESREWDDGAVFVCPGDEAGEEDSARSLVAGAMAVLATASMMA